MSSSAPIGLHATLFPLASLIFLLTLTAYLSRREKVGLNSMSERYR
ncbi:sortase B protein-sorting domain-containing protein [Klebsiella aerogenes]